MNDPLWSRFLRFVSTHLGRLSCILRRACDTIFGHSLERAYLTVWKSGKKVWRKHEPTNARTRCQKTRFFMKKSHRFITGVEPILKKMIKMSQNGRRLPGAVFKIITKVDKKLKKCILSDLSPWTNQRKFLCIKRKVCFLKLQSNQSNNHNCSLRSIHPTGPLLQKCM